MSAPQPTAEHHRLPAIQRVLSSRWAFAGALIALVCCDALAAQRSRRALETIVEAELPGGANEYFDLTITAAIIGGTALIALIQLVLALIAGSVASLVVRLLLRPRAPRVSTLSRATCTAILLICALRALWALIGSAPSVAHPLPPVIALDLSLLAAVALCCWIVAAQTSARLWQALVAGVAAGLPLLLGVDWGRLYG